MCVCMCMYDFRAEKQKLFFVTRFIFGRDDIEYDAEKCEIELLGLQKEEIII
jgi:hypothetical protein